MEPLWTEEEEELILPQAVELILPQAVIDTL
jgi:hypothetical protein